MANPHFEIYATKDSLLILNDPTRIRIMHFLAESEKDFDEISRYTGKAKSTVSTHMDKLENNALATSMLDPKDNRRKIYKIKAELIAISSKTKPILYILNSKYFNKLKEGKK